MKDVLNFIRNNPLKKGEFYNHVQNIFGIQQQNGRIHDYIFVGSDHTYFVIDGFLYAENNETGRSKKYKI